MTRSYPSHPSSSLVWYRICTVLYRPFRVRNLLQTKNCNAQPGPGQDRNLLRPENRIAQRQDSRGTCFEAAQREFPVSVFIGQRGCLLVPIYTCSSWYSWNAKKSTCRYV